MFPAKPKDMVGWKRVAHASSGRPFHDRLMARSQTALTDLRKRPAPLALPGPARQFARTTGRWGRSARSFWQAALTGLTGLPSTADWRGAVGRLAGQGAIFIGGLMIGGGLVLLKKGEALAPRPGLMLAAGVGLLVIGLVANLLTRESSGLGPSTARG